MKIEVLCHSSIRIESKGKIIYSDPFRIKEEKKDADIMGMIQYLSPYLSDSEREMMNQFSSMQENMEQFKQMSAMMQMMNEMGGSPEEALQGFLSEEQMAMFKMFGEDLS